GVAGGGEAAGGAAAAGPTGAAGIVGVVDWDCTDWVFFLRFGIWVVFTRMDRNEGARTRRLPRLSALSSGTSAIPPKSGRTIFDFLRLGGESFDFHLRCVDPSERSVVPSQRLA